MPSSAPKAAARRPRAVRTSRSRTRSQGAARSGAAGDLNLVELISLAEQAVGSLHEVFEALDASILQEFGAIAASISRAREDIGRLQPHDLSARRIPDAGRELAAVVEATEEATNRIMEAAERMLEAGSLEPDAYRALIETEVTTIFEACSFQDITGQRVSKVVEALEDIDERVSRIGRALGASHVAPAEDSREAARMARKDALILNGPAGPGSTGVAQHEVDALFD